MTTNETTNWTADFEGHKEELMTAAARLGHYAIGSRNPLSPHGLAAHDQEVAAAIRRAVESGYNVAGNNDNNLGTTG